jgi:short-subunit dehydrogenase
MNATQSARALKSVVANQWRSHSPLARRAPKNFAGKYGPWALIAGASEGIGGAWADYAASQGLSVVIVARDPEKLEKKRQELVTRFGVEVVAISQELGTADAAENIIAAVGDREIGFLVYNAALATVGGFFADNLEFERRRIHVNCVGPFELTYHYGKLMKERRRGGIVLMTSGTGLIGSPYYTHYGATRAYNIILAEGLWYELKPHNVDVLACMAGLTSSPGTVDALDVARARGSLINTPEENVEEAVLYLGKRPSMQVGAPNRRMMFVVTRLLPRALGIREIGKHALNNFLDGVRP